MLSFGQTWDNVIVIGYKAKLLYSGKDPIPGQVSSVGVPSNLKILFNWSSTSLPGNKGRPALANSEKKFNSMIKSGRIYWKWIC